MESINNYQLILLDFDGLLVNTEEFHYKAYQKMCAARGVVLDWSFQRYCQAAHYEADALKKQLYSAFPKLFMQEPNWNVLYAEKKAFLENLFHSEPIQLMPGVERFLLALEKANITRCVVTHSPESLVQLIRQANPLLNTIPLWMTREHYKEPKPNSECYLKAIESFSKPHDRIIGFEDTPRGIRALMGTRAQPVLVCDADYPEIPYFLERGVLRYKSFLDFASEI